ncbi:MAG TPA: hypothetical protein VGQ29_06285 [Gemmatimonadales bacterium]|jgi:uncharacterized protein (DUF1778 family)|nr:hypothetical protein [Gemmatimonadales bacterium]
MPQKTDAVGLKLHPDDRRLIEAAAEALDVPLSELVRRAAGSYSRGVIEGSRAPVAQPQVSDE